MTDEEKAEKRRAYSRAWTAKNPEKRKAQSRRSWLKRRHVQNIKREAKRKANREAVNAYNRQWRKNHPESRRAYKKKWCAKNRAKVNAQKKAWEMRYPERARRGYRRIQLRNQYGLTLEQYDAILSVQNGRCAICLSDKVGGKGPYMYVDHNHATKAVRGLLCARCNPALGHFGENLEIIFRAVEYLRHATETQRDYRRSTVQQILAGLPEASSPIRCVEGMGQSQTYSGTSGPYVASIGTTEDSDIVAQRTRTIHPIPGVLDSAGSLDG